MIFQVALGNYAHLSCTQEFIDDVTELPAIFDPNDYEHVELFESFFSRWGHYVITKIYGGGSVAVEVTSSGTTAQDFNKLKVTTATAIQSVAMFCYN